mmetsp:Transcript_62974/g.182626  ORF Transcript_62974/g.182626 Transcript_62974/m.182626 type:complete len:300 (-) Transcript_62974:1873-2772(-)
MHPGVLHARRGGYMGRLAFDQPVGRGGGADGEADGAHTDLVHETEQGCGAQMAAEGGRVPHASLLVRVKTGGLRVVVRRLVGPAEIGASHCGVAAGAAGGPRGGPGRRQALLSLAEADVGGVARRHGGDDGHAVCGADGARCGRVDKRHRGQIVRRAIGENTVAAAHHDDPVEPETLACTRNVAREKPLQADGLPRELLQGNVLQPPLPTARARIALEQRAIRGVRVELSENRDRTLLVRALAVTFVGRQHGDRLLALCVGEVGADLHAVPTALEAPRAQDGAVRVFAFHVPLGIEAQL